MIDFPKLGGAFTASGLALMQFAADKRMWWVGFALTLLGPVLLSWRPRNDKLESAANSKAIQAVYAASVLPSDQNQNAAAEAVAKLPLAPPSKP